MFSGARRFGHSSTKPFWHSTPYPNSGPYTSGHSRILLKVAIAIGPGCMYGIVYCPDTRTGRILKRLDHHSPQDIGRRIVLSLYLVVVYMGTFHVCQSPSMMMDRPSFCSSHVVVVQYCVWLSVHKCYSTYSEHLHAEVYQYAHQ